MKKTWELESRAETAKRMIQVILDEFDLKIEVGGEHSDKAVLVDKESWHAIDL